MTRTFPQCRNLALCGACVAGFGIAQISAVATDKPIGMILDGGDAQLQQPVIRSKLKALTATLLFPGDIVETGGKPAVIALCQTPDTWSIRPGSKVLIEGPAPKVLKGLVERMGKPAACELPRSDRFPVAAIRAPPGAKPAFNDADGSPKTRERRIGRMPDSDARQLVDRLAPIESALRSNPRDPAARVAQAVLLDQFHLSADARFEYGRIAEDFPGAAWTRGVKLVSESEPRNPGSGDSTPGKTFALLIGVSSYKPETGISSLQFADHDATAFRDFLKSPRGGALPDSQIMLLTNEAATRERVENGLEGFVRESEGPNNTLIVLIAAHGATVPLETTGARAKAAAPEDPQAYILTYDTNPQDVATAGIAMARLRETVTRQVWHFRQVMVYLDVCRAGDLWPVRVDPSAVAKEARKDLQTASGNLGILLATSPDEKERYSSAYESADLDNHGAFTYYVLSGLNGGVEPAARGKVLFDDLADDVRKKVRFATDQKQRPFGQSAEPNLVVVEDATAKGIALAPPGHLPIVIQPALRGGKRPARETGKPATDADDAKSRFFTALHLGRLLPGDGDAEDARAILARMRSQHLADEPELGTLAEQLRVALEEMGQDVLLAYLRGAQPPLAKTDFERGRDYFAAALEIFADSPYDESRKLFCEGRAELFDGNYARAVALLEASIRLDPTRAYAYNALGIAWLQQLPRDARNADRAQAAFDDAMRFAPYWAYPLHNMALLDAALGNYELAFETLERAIRLAPLYSYLPYTLGLLNQQLNRAGEAEHYYRQALDAAQKLHDQGKDRRVPGRWPERAEILNALGTLADQAGRARRAVGFYQEAIAADPATTGARLNLADKLSEAGRPSPEAESLWRALIAEDGGLLAPRLKFGEYLARLGRTDEATVQYEAAVRLEPSYFDGRIALVRLLQKAGKTASALSALPPAVALASGNAAQTETVGDVYSALGSKADALEAWRRARTLVELETNSSWRRDSLKRLSTKIAALTAH